MEFAALRADPEPIMATQSNSTPTTSAAFASTAAATPAGGSNWMAEADRKWNQARERFLAAVADDQRAAVDQRLNDLGARGAGLRTWLTAIAWRGGVLPQRLPRELMQIYLDDAEARPRHECEACGLLIPVQPARRRGAEVIPLRIYFSNCPVCDAGTGWYVFRSKAFLTLPAEQHQNRTG